MINRITIKGIGSYGNETQLIELGRGKNIIVGENATGKSALLFAIEVGFLGSLEEWDLRDVINDDADEAEVTIDFIHPKTGNQLQIRRKFRRMERKGKEIGSQIEVCLKNMDTGEILADRPESVERVIRALGIDKNVFLNIIHVKQGRIDRILRSSALQREMFDKLFGIHDLKNALSELGSRRGEVYSGILKELDNKRQHNREKITARRELANEFENKKLELESLNKKVRELEAQEKELEAEFEHVTKLWEAVEPLVKKVDEIRRKMQTLQNSIDQAEESLKRLYEQVKLKNRQLYERIRKIITEAAQEPEIEKQIVEVLNQRIKDIEEKEKSVSELEKQKESIENDLRELTGREKSIRDQIERFELQIQRIERFLKGKEELVEIKCELCGSLLKPSQYKRHLEEVKKERDKERNKLNEIKVLLQEKTELSLTIDGQIREINELIKEKSALALLAESIDVQIKTKLTNLGKLKECHDNLNKNLKELNELLKETVTIEKVSDKLAEIKTRKDTLPVKINNVQREIMKIKEEQIPKLIVEVEKRKKAKEEIEKLEKENEKISRKIDFLANEIRPALEDIQPVIRRLLIDSINNRAAIYFEKFYGRDSRYKREDIRRIWMDDEYRFWVDRMGHVKQATRLSGGQSIVISLCFLFALLDELGSSLGFLLLDEPSNHLDNKRIEELIEVLKSLQNVPQLIIVDHKQELINTADIKYEVSLVNGFSQIRRIE